jgi:hypothetical protein
MTKQHKATPEQWALTEETSGACLSACILELRARVEALEAAQQPPQDKLDRLMAIDADDGEPIVMPSSPAGSLVERVLDCLPYRDVHQARAAILVMADWMSKQPCGKGWAKRLEQEANR